jgi:hypothetical protein
VTPEGRVKAKVKRALDKLGPDCWRFMPVQTGYGSQALDFLLVIRGRFVAIETKAPGKGLTPMQEGTKAAIEAAGGIVLVVRDESSLAIAMKIILSLEFAPNATPAFDAINDYTLRTGVKFDCAVRHNTPQAERIYEEHDRAEQSAQAADPAAGGDHGAPGAQPQGRSQSRSRVEDQ